MLLQLPVVFGGQVLVAHRLGQRRVPHLVLEERVFEHGDAIERCQQPFVIVGRGGRVKLFADDLLDDHPGRRLVSVPLVEQVFLYPFAVFALAAGGLHVDQFGAPHLA
ncbi:hypothetical protein D3C78_1636580 [compost metagenome]